MFLYYLKVYKIRIKYNVLFNLISLSKELKTYG